MPAGKGKWWETLSTLELAYLSLATDDLAGKLDFGFVFLARIYIYELAFKLGSKLLSELGSFYESLFLLLHARCFFLFSQLLNTAQSQCL